MSDLSFSLRTLNDLNGINEWRTYLLWGSTVVTDPGEDVQSWTVNCNKRSLRPQGIVVRTNFPHQLCDRFIAWLSCYVALGF